MKLLMLSTDGNLFRRGSDVRARIAGYGATAESVHVVVLGRGGAHRLNDGVAPNVFLYGAIGKNRIKRLIAAYRTAGRLLSSGGRWVISAQDPFEVGTVGFLLRVRFGVPLELQVHTDFLNHYFAAESVKNRFRVFLGKLLVPRADSVRVVSERIRAGLLARRLVDPGSVSVLPVFLNPDDFRSDGLKRVKKGSGKAAAGATILMMSRLAREKNIPLAIKAVGKLIANHPNLTLRIIGDGPELKKLQRITKNLSSEGGSSSGGKLNKNVQFEPWTNNAAAEYQSADMFLITSNYEGYGRTAVEAMLMGIPVVMTDVGVAGSLVRDGETGRVVPVGDAGALAEAIGDLIEHPEEREAIRAAARKAVRKLPEKSDYFRAAGALFRRLRPKLCYVLPSYHEDDSTHFAYQARFIGEVAKEYDARLILGRGAPPRGLGVRNVFTAEARSAAGRFALMAYRLIGARLAGYRTFYIHYSFFAALLAKVFQGRVYYWNCGEPWKYRRNIFRESFERITYRAIDMLVTGTEGLKQAYARHYRIPPSHISVVPNWISEEQFGNRASSDARRSLRKSLGIPPEAKVVLFVHRLSKRKGAHYLPEILAKLGDRNAVFIVVGDGPEKENLQLAAKNLKLQERIQFVGSVPNRELGAYYAAADVFLMPSDEEGFPHVLLEAMLFGLPFAVADVGGVRDIVPRAMYDGVIPPGDTARFAARLDELLRLPESARRSAGEFLWEQALRYGLDGAASAFRGIVG